MGRKFDNYSNEQFELDTVGLFTEEIDEDELYECLERALKGRMYSKEEGEKIMIENARKYGQEI